MTLESSKTIMKGSTALRIASLEVATVEFAIFVDCTNSNGNGGAILISNAFTLVAHCSFDRCTAVLGGGIHSTKSIVIIDYSTFRRTQSTRQAGDDNLGGNSVCVDSGDCLQVSHGQFYQCAPIPDPCGDSLVVTHASKNDASYLNITKCFGRAGSFFSMLNPLEESKLSFINAVASKDWSMIENYNFTCHIYYSNFIDNIETYAFLYKEIKCQKCVFLRNEDKRIGDNVLFFDCIGTFYGNSRNVTSTSTINFPAYHIIPSKNIKKFKFSNILSLSFLSKCILVKTAV